MIKDVKQLFYSPIGTQEPFEHRLKGFSFSEIPDLEFKDEIIFKGQFLRVEEGIMMLLDELEAVELVPCARCQKMLEIKLPFKPSEWLFYAKKPEHYDDANEFLLMDLKQFTLDIYDPIRQELLLAHLETPHCDPVCIELQDSEPKGILALAGLKDLQF